MSGSFKRAFLKVLYNVPELLLSLLAWVLLCGFFKEALPPLWIVFAFPVSLLSAAAVKKADFKLFPSLLLILIIPWLIRYGFRDISKVYFDNGFFLTLPYLYFISVFEIIKTRKRSFTTAKIVILLFLSMILLGQKDFLPVEISASAEEPLRLILAVVLSADFSGALFLSQRQTAAENAGLDFFKEILKKNKAAEKKNNKNRNIKKTAGKIVYPLLISAVFIILVLFSGRINQETSLRSGGGLLNSSMFRFDFSDVLSLEPEISLNSELTLIYREDNNTTKRYLRRFTLSGWNEKKGFFRDEKYETDFPGRQPLPAYLPKGVKIWNKAGFSSRVPVHQEYYLAALDPQSFFSLNYPYKSESWKIWDNASFVKAYSVDSMVSVAGPWELSDVQESGIKEVNGLPDNLKKYYLKGGSNEYFKSLADQITSNAGNQWEKVHLIEQWFLDNFYYSLKPGIAPDGNQLEWFLKKTHKGYCSYFAFAMTRICRAAGIPARVAVGFITDPETNTLGFIPVRSDQAHAWVEVWFDNYGWIIFDPTSSVMAPGEDYPVKFISPDEWLPLVEEILSRSGEVTVDTVNTEKTENSILSWESIKKIIKSAGFKYYLYLFFMLIFILYFPFRIIVFIKYILSLFSHDYRRRTIASWRYFAVKLCRAGYRSAETPYDWSVKLEKEEALTGFAEWSSMYLKAMYSFSYTKDDFYKASAAERTVKDSWRKKPFIMRLKTFLSISWRCRY